MDSRELSGQFCGCFSVGRSRFLGRVEVPQLVTSSGALYFGSPIVSIFGYALKPAAIVFWFVSVVQILRRRSPTQIFPSVIVALFILVVYFVFGPLTCYPEPYNSVRQIVLSLNHYPYITIVSYSARYGSGGDIVGRSILVKQFSRISLVIKEFSDKINGQVSVSVLVSSGHAGTLAQMPLLVNAPL